MLPARLSAISRSNEDGLGDKYAAESEVSLHAIVISNEI